MPTKAPVTKKSLQLRCRFWRKPLMPGSCRTLAVDPLAPAGLTGCQAVLMDSEKALLCVQPEDQSVLAWPAGAGLPLFHAGRWLCGPSGRCSDG